MKTFIPLAMAICTTLAAPTDNAEVPLTKNISDNTPLCGYVRIEENAWWSVGLQTHGICEPIWQNEAAVIYRIDRQQCGCAFFRTEEECKGKGDAILHRGPYFNETHFLEDERPTWVLCQAIKLD